MTESLNYNFTCPHEGCNRKFEKKWSLTRHMRTHNGDKPFRCEICNKVVEISILNKHLRIVCSYLLKSVVCLDTNKLIAQIKFGNVTSEIVNVNSN